MGLGWAWGLLRWARAGPGWAYGGLCPWANLVVIEAFHGWSIHFLRNHKTKIRFVDIHNTPPGWINSSELPDVGLGALWAKMIFIEGLAANESELGGPSGKLFRFVSCVRARGAYVRSDLGENLSLVTFPFPFLDREVFPFPSALQGPIQLQLALSV